ncbi:MAG: YdcF family protein [Polyangiaceae bacterium]
MVLCVLGCRVDSRALARRCDAAVEAYRSGAFACVLASGGRAWGGVLEADHIAARLADAGIADVIRERCSLDTRDNARFSAALLARRGIEGSVTLVTCDWHMPRAERLFRAVGLDVRPHAALSPRAGLLTRVYREARERASWARDARRVARAR